MVFKKNDYRGIVDAILKDLRERSPVADTNIGSVSRTLVESVGREISIMYDQMEAAYNAGFIDTAKGTAHKEGIRYRLEHFHFHSDTPQLAAVGWFILPM